MFDLLHIVSSTISLKSTMWYSKGKHMNEISNRIIVTDVT